MGLITKEVEIRLWGQMISYYESLGYKIPRKDNGWGKMIVPKGTTITINAFDLKPQSDILVDVECDCCGKHINVQYSRYVKYNRDGKYYCHSCALAVFNSGENNPNWNPNKTDEEREDGRSYPEYIDFIKRVMARDNYICQCCGKDATDVHHLYGYAGFPEYRIDQTQSLALCSMCHMAFHKWHRENFGYENRGNCTKEQFENWLGYALKELKKYDGVLSVARKIFDYEENKIYDSASQYSEIHNVRKSSVTKVCNHYIGIAKTKRKDGANIPQLHNSIKGHHLFWLDEYEKMTKEEIDYFINKRSVPSRKIVCIITGEIFKSFGDAIKKYNLWMSSLSKCCNGKQKTTGKLPDGTLLVWMYYEDFLKLPQEEQNEILARNKESSNDGSF